MKAAIWPNETDDGLVRHNATFSRLYKDTDDQWQSTQSFGRGALLVLAKLADQAHSRIFELQRVSTLTGRVGRAVVHEPTSAF